MIILFTVIIPKTSTKGKLKHAWSYDEDGVTWGVFDFRNNTVSELEYWSYIWYNETEYTTSPIQWSVNGDILTVQQFDPDDITSRPDVEHFRVTFLNNDRVLILTDSYGDSTTLTRRD